MFIDSKNKKSNRSQKSEEIREEMVLVAGNRHNKDLECWWDNKKVPYNKAYLIKKDLSIPLCESIDFIPHICVCHKLLNHFIGFI